MTETERQLTIDVAFAEALDAVADARTAVERVRTTLRYRTLTTKDADKIRRLSVLLATAVPMLEQLRDVAEDRQRREGTLA